jgi:hypothetical protein
MRSAAHQAGTGGPDTGADLAATLAQLRQAMRRPGNSDATAGALAAIALALADIGAALLERNTAMERNTAALAVAGEQVELGRQLAARPPCPPVPAARAVRVLRALPG